MAAPASKTIHDLNGKWAMNKKLSDDVGPTLELQGISWLTRKAIGLASVNLHIKQYEDEDGTQHVNIEQTATGGLKGTTEERTLDNAWHEHKDWLFGEARGRSLLVSEVPEDSGDAAAFLKTNWEEGTTEWIYSYVESLDNDWTAKQTWGFQLINGERRYARNVVVEKGKKKSETRLVYDWISE